MCLIMFNWAPDSQTPLILASNRDEFHARPSLDAHFWQDNPSIFAGRDLEKKGTWLGVSKSDMGIPFRLAALTNVRDMDKTAYQHSRGEITQGFLSSHDSALSYAKQLAFTRYAGFNGLFFDGQTLVYCHAQKNQTPIIHLLPAGTYGLSNAELDTPWPKVRYIKSAFEKLNKADTHEGIANHLFNDLKDNTPASDAELPETGVGIDLERMLSPAFIISPSYGSRTSSVIIISQQDNQPSVYFEERQYSPEGKKIRTLSNTLTNTRSC